MNKLLNSYLSIAYLSRLCDAAAAIHQMSHESTDLNDKGIKYNICKMIEKDIQAKRLFFKSLHFIKPSFKIPQSNQNHLF